MDTIDLKELEELAQDKQDDGAAQPPKKDVDSPLDVAGGRDTKPSEGTPTQDATTISET